jgi:allantoinase
MPSHDLIIRGRRVVLPHTIASRSIHIRAGRIVFLGDYQQLTENAEVIDVDDDSVIMPGLVDTHVHINAPGRTEWEGFRSATRAAAAGGVTTVVDMPLNSIPPTTTLRAFDTKLGAARDECFVDVGFWGGVVPWNIDELLRLHTAGVVGFKCFLVPSGVDEFEYVTEADLREAMPELTRLRAPLIVHAELPGSIHAGGEGSPRAYQTFLDSRPPSAENDAIALMIRLSREFGTRVHIVHLSSAEAIPMLRKAQRAGVKITAETCPHYLHFAAEQIPAGATEFKCCPPIRERANREALWDGLNDGTIDLIVSDHSPCPAEMKLRESGDFMKAWGGIASLQLRLPVVWTEARRRGFSLQDVTRWLCTNPARQVSFQRQKGSIAVGSDADLVIWKPDQEFTVTPALLHHRHKITPYAGEVLRGVVQQTLLRGNMIYHHGQLSESPIGEVLLRPS